MKATTLPFLAPLLVLSAHAAATEMRPVTINGLRVSGAEYWPFVGDTPFSYPDDVEWGFDGGGAAAQRCAQASFDRLEAFLTANPAKMRRAVALGATSSFFLWTNDYSRATPGRERRPHRMWHWNGGDTPDYSLGYWKWEATLTQTGACLIPTSASVEQALDGAIATLEDRL